MMSVSLRDRPIPIRIAFHKNSLLKTPDPPETMPRGNSWLPRQLARVPQLLEEWRSPIVTARARPENSW